MTWEEAPGFLAVLEAGFLLAEEIGAHEAAALLREKLDQPGSGIQHPELPNVSSRPGEYPARQFDKLINSIDAQLISGVWAFGSFNAPVEAFELEYPPPGHVARPWLSKFLADPLLRERVFKSMSEVLS